MAWPFRSGDVQRRSISFQDVWGRGGDTTDVLGIGPEGALRLIPLYACTRLIADQFAAAPLHGYRERPDGTRERMNPQPQIVRAPSPVGQTVFTWKYQVATSLLVRGNAYGLITAVDADGWPTAIVWLNPSHVSVDESDEWNPRYYWNGRELDRHGLVHIPAYVLAGKWVGLSVIGMFRVALETGQLAQEAARDWFANGMAPTGHFKNTAKTLEDGQAATVKQRFKAAIANRDVLVTGNDWEWSSIAVNAADAQFVESTKLTATQIATLYGVPPEMVGGESGGSMTYQNVEQQALNFVTYTMRPWFSRVEEALTAHLRPAEYAKFNADAIVRADLKTRMEAHEIALRTGMETQDEGRALEDKPPLTDDQRKQWAATYGNSTKQRDLAETIQKIYLGVGKVITSEEARRIANEAGADLDLPGPVFAPTQPPKEQAG